MPYAGALTQLRASAPVISVGLLSANLARLGDEVRALEEAGAQVLHVDIMDGSFCPMMTVGPPVVKAVRTPLLKDVHLMIDDPLRHVESFVAAGADMVTFHIEGVHHPHRVLQAMASMPNANDPGRGIVRGVAMNPGTPVSAVEALLADLEYVLVLAVNPGWPGQPFIDSAAAKVVALQELVRKTGVDVLVGLDGGVTQANIHKIAGLGCDIVVAGSAVYAGGKSAENLRALTAELRGLKT